MLILYSTRQLLVWVAFGHVTLYSELLRVYLERRLDTLEVILKILLTNPCMCIIIYAKLVVMTIISFSGDHTEVIEIHYDPTSIRYDQLLNLFWDNHEYGLTTRVKRQYMSLILYHDDDQRQTAELSMKKQAEACKEKLITVLAPAGPFYPAEEYELT